MMTRYILLLAVICCAQGCSSIPVRDQLLKKSWSYTRAYQIEYLDRDALATVLAEHDAEQVLFLLETEVKQNWTYLEHSRFTPKLLNDLLDAMEDIKPGSGRALVMDLTAKWRYELETDFRDQWLETHNKEGLI